MSPTHKRLIIKSLQASISSLFFADPEMYNCIKLPSVRAATIIQRTLNLCPTTTTLEQALTQVGLPASQNSLPDLFEAVAQRFLAFRITQPPPIDQTGLKVVSWNVTALSPSEDPYKCRVLARLAQDHVVCVQETKMTAADATLLEMQLPGCKVLATHAVDAQAVCSNSQTSLTRTPDPEQSSGAPNTTLQASSSGGGS